MNKITLYQFVKKKCLVLTFFVLFSLIISENVYAQKRWTRECMEVTWDKKMGSIILKMEIYDYLFAGSAHGYLKWCTVYSSINGRKYYKLFNILTERQEWSNTTMTNFRTRDFVTSVRFLDNVVSPAPGSYWPDLKHLKVTVNNFREYANITLAVRSSNLKIHYVKFAGNWHVDAPNSSFDFEDVVYCLDKHFPSKLKTPEINTTLLKNDPVKVFNESEAIVIKGAELGANIKVFTTSGVELKSVISNNDVVKIKLPEKQIYIVHVGKSRYKVAL